MTDSSTKKRYSDAQLRVRNVVSSLNDYDYRSQFHHELSALGWHLAHCLYIENYWLHEVLCDDDSLTKNLDQFYIPEKSYKPDRGAQLCELKQLIKQASEYQSNNLECLNNLTAISTQQHLLNDNYLQNFIIQHYDQHYESMQMALQQRALKRTYPNYVVTNTLSACKPIINTVNIEKGNYLIGSNASRCYDNEQPQFENSLQHFSISTNPVSNGEYLSFMQDAAYQNKSLWSDDGWQWVNKHSSQPHTISPEHWRQDKKGYWFGINDEGAHDLISSAPLYGINYYEACAYATWCNARLPHEHEWEVAHKKGLLQNTGQVWEWCDNLFYAYPDFKAFPYDGYSTPSFEDKHHTLKGGSLHTQENIKRPSFRNFFGPDKRHVFTGLRLVY